MESINDTSLQNLTTNNNRTIPNSVQLIRIICIPIWSIIIIVGLIGNILTIKVLRFRHIKTSSTAVYLTALAVTDLLYLICSTSVSLIDYIFFFSIGSVRHISPFLCHVQPVFQYSLSHISVWLLVAVTFDRMILVTLPFTARKFSNQKNAMIIIACIVAIFILVDLHFIWTMKYLDECQGQLFTIKIFPYIDLALMGIIPFMSMIFCNLAIILKLRALREIREKNLNKNRKSNNCPETSIISDDKLLIKKFKDKTGNLTKMLLCTNLFFMISITPLLIYDILYFSIDFYAMVKQNEDFWGGIFFGTERSVYTIWYLNFCIHFFVYCLSGPNFRDAAKKVLKLEKEQVQISNLTKMSDYRKIIDNKL